MEIILVPVSLLLVEIQKVINRRRRRRRRRRTNEIKNSEQGNICYLLFAIL
jgi:hypothetical protein